MRMFIFYLLNISILTRCGSQDSVYYYVNISNYIEFAKNDCRINKIDFSNVISIPIFRLNKPNKPFNCSDDICYNIEFINSLTDQLILVCDDNNLKYYKLIDSFYIKIMSPMIPTKIIYNKFILNKSFVNINGWNGNLDITKLLRIKNNLNNKYADTSNLIFFIYGFDEIFYWYLGRIYVVLLRGKRAVLEDANKYFLDNYSIDYLNDIADGGTAKVGYKYKKCIDLQRNMANDHYINLIIK